MPISPGQVFEREFQVTPEVVTGFGQLFQDQNPLHTDTAFARNHGFRDRVVYGNVLSGYLSFLVGEMLPVKNVAILSQKINFSHAVYQGETLKLSATVSGVFDETGVIELKFKFHAGAETKARGLLQVKIL
jgi:3-hydroxybutyryl-CoA dehydratase